MTRLSEALRQGIIRGSRTQWRTARMTRTAGVRRGDAYVPGYTGVIGTTQEALARRGLAECRYGIPMEYRLTDAGEALRLKMVADRRRLRLLPQIEQAHKLAAAAPAGTPDFYIPEAYLRGECSNAVMERALALRCEMHEAAAGCRGKAAA